MAALFLATLCCVAAHASTQSHAPSEGVAIRVGQPFTLGPFAQPLMPVPLGLAVDLEDEDASTPWKVVELDDRDAEVAVYPCMIFNARNGHEIRFVPFDNGSADRWPAGEARRFVIRRAQEARAEAAQQTLAVERDGETLTIRNTHYAIMLRDPASDLEGSANDIIQKIAFGDADRSLRAVRTTSDVVLDGQVYRWRFEPSSDAVPIQVTEQFASVEYRGRFGAPGSHAKVDQLRWHLTFTFYAAIPLIEVDVRMDQRDGRADRFDLCRFLQIHFDPSDDTAPLRDVQAVEGGRRGLRDLIAAYGEEALLAVVNKPHAMATGTLWMREPPTSAFLCSIWEGNVVPAETLAETGFYLLISSDPSLKRDMTDYWSSLSSLSDLNERVRIRRLFDAN